MHPRHHPSPLVPALVALALALALLIGSARADEVVLKDGRRFEGTIREETQEKVVIETRFGELEFERAEVSETRRGKTRAQTFEERWKAAKTGSDFYALGVWAGEQKLKAEAKKCMQKVVRLEPDHQGAREFLGFVRYGGEWMTPEERDARVLADEDERMAARGLVRFGERWVTPEEQGYLEQGMVFHEGRWRTNEEVQAAKGLTLWKGAWIAAELARSLQDAEAVGALVDVRLNVTHCANAVVAGPQDAGFLGPIGAGLDAGRAWFDRIFGLGGDAGLFGDRLPQIYVWDRDSAPYQKTTDHFASLTHTVPEGWADAVKGIHGFYWTDPYCVSSARVWNRPDDDVYGHSYHHWGHLLLGRLGYDGRLLPTWYDEGFAALMEFVIHEQNRVFCMAKAQPVVISGPTSVKKKEFLFESKDFRRGSWREKLRAALADGLIPPFDDIAQKEFGGLTLLDIAASMGIIEWLSTREGGTLARFHAELRAAAPPPPQRILVKGAERQAVYDRAFQAAVELPWRGADRAWRTWFLEES